MSNAPASAPAGGGSAIQVQIPSTPVLAPATPSPGVPTLTPGSTFRPRPLAHQKSAMFAEKERQILRAEFNRFDKDGNGILDEKEFRAYLTELKLSPEVMNKILATYDTNGDKTIEFEEFLLAAEHFKHVVMQGVVADAMELSTYYQLGCACCLCSLGLCWIPFCVKQSQMEQRAASGKYIQNDAAALKTPAPQNAKQMDFTAASVGGAPVQPNAAR